MSPAWRLFNDWAGAELLSSLPNELPLASRFYCGNRALGFIVIEDLGEGESLIDILLGDSVGRAKAALLAQAGILGQMHAATVGRFEEFATVRTALGPANLSDQSYPEGLGLREDFGRVRSACRALGFPLPPGMDNELEAIITSIEQPEGFLVYTQGDPCPGNDRFSAGRLRLFDFEFGMFRHALLDGSYWRALFPTCSHANRLPAPFIRQLEETYRAELAKSCIAARDEERFQRAMAEACAYWTLRTTGWHLADALIADGQWGIASLRQRILARLSALAERLADLDQLPATTTTCHQLAQYLKGLWPEMEEMPLFPAFR